MSQAQNIMPKYEVEKLEGKVTRTITKYTDDGFQHEEVEEDAGYMIYFPSGASMRARNAEHLRILGIDPSVVPGLVDMETGEEVPQPERRSLKQVAASKSTGRKRSAVETEE
jgi:hypothetical protein